MLLFSIYQFVVTLLFVLLFPFVFLLSKLRGERFQRLGQRFGLNFRSLPRKKLNSVRIWIHAASVGEVQAAGVLIAELNGRRDDLDFLLSTMTKHGRSVAEKQMPGNVISSLAPLDVTHVVRRFLRVVDPDLYICMETELWPAMFIELQGSSIPSLILNGRMTPRSFRRYSKIRSLIGAVLRSLSGIAVISEEDGMLFTKLGVPAKNLRITGNIKYDYPALDTSDMRYAQRNLLQADQEIVFISGSTRTGEEEILLPVFRMLQQKGNTGVIWVIAPRHLERLDEIEKFLTESGLEFDRFSNLNRTGRSSTVVLVDTMGDLGRLYCAGDMNFVGGSLVSKRGHNIMEAARWGRPVYYGPSIDDFGDAADILEKAGGGFKVQNGKELAKVLVDHLQDKKKYEKACVNAAKAVSLQRGAAGRQAEMVLNLLSKAAQN